MSPAMRRRTWSRKSSTRASTIAWSYLSYLYMSDHPVAGRGVGGLYRQVRAHGRAARANAVLDMSGARPLRGAHGVDHIAAVDAAGAFLGGQARPAMLAGVAGEIGRASCRERVCRYV